MKTYSQVIKLKTFKERYEYLKIGKFIEWNNRIINQMLYQQDFNWKSIRRQVIIRDNGCDLASEDIPISGIVIVHHINPITEKDILSGNAKVFDLENLISCSLNTHNAIHYGEENLLPMTEIIERKPNDTCPWR